jgi:tetratricopeptide (TPR) repeat protein
MLVTSHIKVEQYDEAERVCLEIFAEKPEYILSYYYLADIQHKLKKYDLAITHANAFLFRVEEKLAGRSRDHTPVPDNARYRAETYNIIGMCYAETQRYPEALDAYQAATEVADPAFSSQIHYNIGNVHLAQKNYDQAREQYQRAIELNPDLAEAYLNIGLACLYQNKLDAAREYLEKSLSLKPGWGLAVRNLAAVKRKEQVFKTVAECQSLLESNPNQPAVLGQLASSYYLLGRKEEAAAAWTKVLSFEPDSADTLNNLAFVLSENPTGPLFDADKALGYALGACTLSGYQNVSFLDTLAKVHAVKGDFAEAIEATEQALDLASMADQKELTGTLEKKIQAYQEHRMP